MISWKEFLLKLIIADKLGIGCGWSHCSIQKQRCEVRARAKSSRTQTKWLRLSDGPWPLAHLICRTSDIGFAICRLPFAICYRLSAISETSNPKYEIPF